MDYGKSFSFVFDDEEWIQKILIGGILSLIPIVNLVVVGYGLQVLKNVATGSQKPLPAWDDFGDYFIKGLVSSLGSVVWALPMIGVSIAIGVVSALTGYETDPQYVAWPVQCCLSGLGCLSGLYGLLMAALMPAVVTKYAVTGEFGAMFRFGEIYKYITSNLGPYIVALLLGAVAMFIAGFGLIACIIGVAFTGFWATLVGNHLLGEVYRASEAASA
jgi:hypothetical protein